jgi:hypothetical protein
MPSGKRHRIEWYVSTIFFIAFVCADLLLSAKAAVRVAGVVCMATGSLWIFRRSVPVGIEGRPPSYFLNGWIAILAGLAIAAVGMVCCSIRHSPRVYSVGFLLMNASDELPSNSWSRGHSIKVAARDTLGAGR